MSRVASGSSLGVDWADETEDHPRSRAPASLAHGGSSFSTAKGDDSDGREDEDVFEVDVGGGGAPSGERLILRKNTSPAGHAASHAASHGVTQKTLRRSASEASASLMATAAAAAIQEEMHKGQHPGGASGARRPMSYAHALVVQAPRPPALAQTQTGGALLSTPTKVIPAPLAKPSPPPAGTTAGGRPPTPPKHRRRL